MKKVVIFIILILTLSFLVFIVVEAYYQKVSNDAEKDNQRQSTEKLGSQLGIEIDEETIIVYFNSDCHYCENEINAINNNIKYFDNFKLVFLSFEPKSKAIKFLSNYNLSNFYSEVNPELLTTTISGGVPQTFIYENGLLQKHFKGEVKIEAILEVLE